MLAPALGIRLPLSKDCVCIWLRVPLGTAQPGPEGGWCLEIGVGVVGQSGRDVCVHA